MKEGIGGAPAVAALDLQRVHAALHAEEALLAPEGAPAVAHLPELDAVLLTPACARGQQSRFSKASSCVLH